MGGWMDGSRMDGFIWNTDWNSLNLRIVIQMV